MRIKITRRQLNEITNIISGNKKPEYSGFEEVSLKPIDDEIPEEDDEMVDALGEKQPITQATQTTDKFAKTRTTNWFNSRTIRF